jgi:hypothetical protein
MLFRGLSLDPIKATRTRDRLLALLLAVLLSLPLFALAASSPRIALAGPGPRVSKFVMDAISPSQTAGVPINVRIQALDQNDRLIMNYRGNQASLSGTLADSPNGSHPTFSALSWTDGIGTGSVTAKKREDATNQTITVKDISDPSAVVSATSNEFAVLPAVAASVTFSGQPLDTKTGTPIYSVCKPSGTTAPCALTTAGTNPSIGVQVLVRDQFGNPVQSGKTVTVGVTPSVSGLGSPAPTSNSGVATFADDLVITGDPLPLGDRTLSARATDGTTQVTGDSGTFRLVNDLKACDQKRCENTASVNNAGGNQKAFNFITTTSDGGFFVSGSVNVLLASQFLDGDVFTTAPRCGAGTVVGMGSEAIVAGAGILSTQPTTTMLIVIPKETLLAGGLTSRAASSFPLCVGATWVNTTTPVAWTARGGKKGIIDSKEDPAGSKTFWGFVLDCSQLPANTPTSNPCADLRTKNTTAVENYFGWTPERTAQVMRDSDLAFVIRMGFPWDGKGAVYR